MAQSKKWVAFRGNTTVPAGVLGKEEDQKMQVGEPVQLPAAYADHLVRDGFAAFCDAPKKSTPKKPTPKKPAGPSVGEEAAANLKAARARVDDLKAKLGALSEGDDDWVGLTKELGEAETDLTALQSAS